MEGCGSDQLNSIAEGGVVCDLRQYIQSHLQFLIDKRAKEGRTYVFHVNIFFLAARLQNQSQFVFRVWLRSNDNQTIEQICRETMSRLKRGMKIERIRVYNRTL